jgi:hypothetical protein
MSSHSSYFPLALSAGAALAGVGLYLWVWGSSPSEDKNSRNTDDAVLSYDDTLAAMAKILDQLRNIAAQHVRAADNVEEQFAQQGQQVPRDYVMTTIILPHFKNAFQTMQNEVLEVLASFYFYNHCSYNFTSTTNINAQILLIYSGV